MRAIDTNILVYSEILSSNYHSIAQQVMSELAEDILPWAIPWPCIYEFLRVVTHPKVFHPPVPTSIALTDLNNILQAPGLILLHETSIHVDIMNRIIDESDATGNLIHDAHIAALCLEHGVTELITGDRDFARFSHLKTHNPFR